MPLSHNIVLLETVALQQILVIFPKIIQRDSLHRWELAICHGSRRQASSWHSLWVRSQQRCEAAKEWHGKQMGVSSHPAVLSPSRCLSKVQQGLASRISLCSHQQVGKRWLSAFPDPCVWGIGNQHTAVSFSGTGLWLFWMCQSCKKWLPVYSMFLEKEVVKLMVCSWCFRATGNVCSWFWRRQGYDWRPTKDNS